MSVCFPAPEHSVFVIVDVQERLCRAMPHFGERLGPMRRATSIAGLLGVDILLTEQYPKGLGHTVPALAEQAPSGTRVFEKTAFSCWGSPQFAAAVEALGSRAVVLVGMETHVCVQQTALGALQRGYEVVLLADAVCSRSEEDRSTALALMRHEGVKVTSVEALAFDWLGDARNPAFKQVSAIVK